MTSQQASLNAWYHLIRGHDHHEHGSSCHDAGLCMDVPGSTALRVINKLWWFEYFECPVSPAPSSAISKLSAVLNVLSCSLLSSLLCWSKLIKAVCWDLLGAWRNTKHQDHGDEGKHEVRRGHLLNLVDASVRKPNSHVALHIWTTHLTHILDHFGPGWGCSCLFRIP